MGKTDERDEGTPATPFEDAALVFAGAALVAFLVSLGLILWA